MPYTRKQVDAFRQNGVTGAFIQRPDGLYDLDPEVNADNQTPSEMGQDANLIMDKVKEQQSLGLSTPIISKIQSMDLEPKKAISEAPANKQVQEAHENPEQAAAEEVNRDPKELVRKYLQDKYFGQGLDDQALQQEQQVANERRLNANLGRAFQTIGSGLAGNANPDLSFYDQLNKGANQGVEDVLTRRKGLLEDLTAKGKESDFVREAALRDPNSDQSLAVKKMVRKLYPDQFDEETIAGLTAADENLIFKPLQLREQIEARKENAKLLVQGRQQESEQRRNDKKEVQSRLSDKQTQDITDLDKTLDQLKGIEAVYDPAKVGPVRGRVPEVLIPGDESSFRAQVGMVEDAYRRIVTGQAASVSEMAKLKQRIPSVTDRPDQFQAKLKEFKQITQEIRNRTLDNYKRQGKNTENFNSDLPANDQNVEVKTLKNGQQVRVKKLPNGKYVQVD